MTALIVISLIAHYIGLAAIVGGWLSLRNDRPSWSLLVWGARAQLLIGLLLVGLNEAMGAELNHVKIAVKLLVALAVVVCAEIGRVRAKRNQATLTLADAAGGLAILNAVIAFAWS